MREGVETGGSVVSLAPLRIGEKDADPILMLPRGQES